MRVPTAVAAVLFLPLVPSLAASGKGSDPPGVVHMTAEQQKTVGLRTAQAQRRPITQPVQLTGSVTFDPGQVAVLRPYQQARIVRLLAEPGDAVSAGQTLIELDMPGLAELQQNLAGARASSVEAEVGVSVAAASLDRAVILSRDGSMARAEADRRRLVLAQAVEAQRIERARAAMLLTEIGRLAPAGATGIAQLRAPLGGVVVSVGVTPGEAIGTTTDALTVANLHTVMVVAEIPEGEATRIAVGDRVTVSLNGAQGRTWDGKVATLGAQLNPQTRTLPARILIANPDLALRVGMFVEVLLIRTLGREGVVVPAAAVQLIADRNVIFTPDGADSFLAHDVQVGVRGPDSVEIRGGLDAGDTVVTAGSFQLKALLQQAMLEQD